MKRAIFIGSRLSALECIGDLLDIELVKIFVQDDSLLSRKLSSITMFDKIETRIFNKDEKNSVIEDISTLDFDILISNGCPIILPVSKIQKPGQLFVNIHPTLLPELKGRTPLSGVFMTHQKAIGATMHYIDDGIDTGRIISQKSIKLTRDIDQGLVYKISFDLEKEAFVEGMKKLQKNNYLVSGVKQKGKGSYFNRTNELQTANIYSDLTDKIIDKVKSFGIKGQGTNLTINDQSYIIYSAERITNPYLLHEYSYRKTGDIIFAYDDKIIIKTLDGMLKLVDFEII